MLYWHLFELRERGKYAIVAGMLSGFECRARSQEREFETRSRDRSSPW
jgi:hypothetical protein